MRPFQEDLTQKGARAGLRTTALPGNIPFFVTWLSSHPCRPSAPPKSLFLLKYLGYLCLDAPEEQGQLSLALCACIHAPWAGFAQKINLEMTTVILLPIPTFKSRLKSLTCVGLASASLARW